MKNQRSFQLDRLLQSCQFQVAHELWNYERLWFLVLEISLNNELICTCFIHHWSLIESCSYQHFNSLEKVLHQLIGLEVQVLDQSRLDLSCSLWRGFANLHYQFQQLFTLEQSWFYRIFSLNFQTQILCWIPVVNHLEVSLDMYVLDSICYWPLWILVNLSLLLFMVYA